MKSFGMFVLTAREQRLIAALILVFALGMLAMHYVHPSATGAKTAPTPATQTTDNSAPPESTAPPEDE
jgi:hypothetical protein